MSDSVPKAMATRDLGERQQNATIEQNQELLREADGKLLGAEAGRGFDYLMALLGAKKTQHADLVAAHGHLGAERGDDAPVAMEEAEARDALYSELVVDRSILENAYGPVVVKELRLVGSTPADANRLHRAGRWLVDKLRGGRLPPSQDPVLQVDTAAMADRLEPCVDRLGRALDAGATEKLQLRDAVQRKDDSEARYDLLFRAVGDTAAMLFDVMDRHDLARLVKASGRRQGMTVAAAEETRGGEAAAGSDVDTPDTPDTPAVPAPNADDHAA